MDFLTIILVVIGLSLFEIVSSIDNAVINAEVLSGMSARARKWFLLWGMLIAVFAIRGLLPWLIIFLANPALGPFGALTATFSNDPSIHETIEKSAPFLLIAGGTFLVFLFFQWLFLERKNYCLPGERFCYSHGVWFFAIISCILAYLVWASLRIHPMMAFAAVLGSTAFFITHGFKENAQKKEEELKSRHLSDISKLFYLEIIDATFSIDGVLGAFAFTLSVPLILIGNGIGAYVVREFTLRGIEQVKKYIYLKNGAMYSILVLGTIMLLHSFGVDIPEWLSPIATIAIIGYFFFRSHKALSVTT